MRVFIVDDSLLIWARLIEILSEIEGIKVVGFAGRPDEAVERIMELEPDMVILDIKLYGGSGIDVLRNIKREKPDTVVAMFSNYSYPEYREKCFQLGADYFLDKSREFDMITDIMLKKAC